MKTAIKTALLVLGLSFLTSVEANAQCSVRMEGEQWVVRNAHGSVIGSSLSQARATEISINAQNSGQCGGNVYNPPHNPPYNPPYQPPYNPPYNPPYQPPYTPPYNPPYQPPYNPPYVPPYQPPVTRWYTCVSWSRGYQFTQSSTDYWTAQSQATAACRAHPVTSNSECNRNVSCN